MPYCAFSKASCLSIFVLIFWFPLTISSSNIPCWDRSW
jgi:hypothetical protein